MQLRLYVRPILTTVFSLLVLGIFSLMISSCGDDDDSETSPVEELVRFTFINPEGDSLVISNFGTMEMDISDYQLCLGPNQYNAISNYTDIVGDLSLSANETVTIKLGSGTQNVTSLPVENGGLGLFASADDFSSTDPELLLDYVQWGAADQNRVDQAVTAGRWDAAANFISGFSPYTFSGASDQIGASAWQTLAPEDARLKTGFIITATTPNGDVVAKYFSEMPSGTADLTDGQVFSEFRPEDILDGYLYTTGATDGTEGIGRAKVNGNGQIVDDGILEVTGDTRRPAIVDATTGVYTTQASSAEIGVFNPMTMQLEGRIAMSDEELPGPQRMRNLLIRGDEVFTHVVSLQRNVVPFTSVYIQSANYQTGQFIATAEFPGIGLNNWQKSAFANNVDEDGNIYFLASGNPPFSAFGTLFKIPAGSNEFDPTYKVELVAQIAPINQILPLSFFFNYIGNDIALALAITEIPQRVSDIIAEAGGLSNLDRAQLIEIGGLLNTEETGRWIKINVVTQEAVNIAGLPTQGGFTPSFSVVINEEVYVSISTGSENAIYKYNPTTDAVEKAFDVEGGSVAGLIDLSW